MRLNRPTSASIRRNDGRTRLRRWANMVSIEVPFHSIPLDSSETPKLMSLGLVATPRSAKSLISPG